MLLHEFTNVIFLDKPSADTFSEMVKPLWASGYGTVLGPILYDAYLEPVYIVRIPITIK